MSGFLEQSLTQRRLFLKSLSILPQLKRLFVKGVETEEIIIMQRKGICLFGDKVFGGPEVMAKESRDGGYHKPRTVEDLTRRNIETIIHLEEAAKANRTKSDHIADAITHFCGSMWFVWVHLIGFAGWIIINIIPELRHFDPFPFTFLTFIVSLEAIFLSTFILISQNYETRLSERRNQLDLQVNLLSEQENTKILTIIERIAKRLGVRTDDDPSLQVLEQATRPEELVQQIEETTKQTGRAEKSSALS